MPTLLFVYAVDGGTLHMLMPRHDGVIEILVGADEIDHCADALSLAELVRSRLPHVEAP